MKKLLQSKALAWIVFIMVLVYLVCTFKSRMGLGWWCYTDVFFLFMATFLNLLMIYMRKVNRVVASKLNTWVLIFGVLFVIALIAEFFLMAGAT